MEEFHFIGNQPVYSREEDRLLAQRYLPRSAQDRSANPVQIVDIFTAVVVSLPTGFTINSTILITNPLRHRIMGLPEWTIWAGSITDPANLIPGGSAINHTAWRLHGPINTPWHPSTGVAAEQYQTYSRVSLTNNTGSTFVVTGMVKERVIENEGRSQT